MCTKFFADGDVHKYFNPYNSPFDAFINYMNVLSDYEERLNKYLDEKQQQLKITKPINIKHEKTINNAVKTKMKTGIKLLQ
jgi:alpha-amylase